MDGIPRGESLFERYVNKARPGSRLIRSAMAQKIEQGIGRGVRSGSDYCVIILIGNDLVQFLSLKENQELLSPQTRIQIEMGLSFSKQAKEGPDPIKNLLDLMNQCLNRNSNWMKYHQTMVQKAKEISVELLPIKLAEAEKRLNPLEEAKFIELIKEKCECTLYSNSENSIGWILENLGFTGLPGKIELFKNKVKFRELLQRLYPELYFKSVIFEELDEIRVEEIEKPFIIKPAVGFFSLGVHKVSTNEEWDSVRKSIKAEAEDIKQLYPAQVLNVENFIIEGNIEGTSLRLTLISTAKETL